MSLARVYQALLKLYPRDYRAAFELEMLAAFEQAVTERRALGRLLFARFTFTEIAGLLLSVASEWIAKGTTSSSLRGRTLPDLEIMRPAGVPRELWFASPHPAADEMGAVQQQIEFCRRCMEHAIANHDFPGARFYSDQDLKARERLRQLRIRQGLRE